MPYRLFEKESNTELRVYSAIPKRLNMNEFYEESKMFIDNAKEATDYYLPSANVTVNIEKIDEVVIEPTYTLEESQKLKIDETYVYLLNLEELSSVSVNVANGTYLFGTDKDTQANLEKVLLGVLANTTPNPRYWTPKGELSPILVTHDELKTISSAVGNAYDSLMQAYLVHKATILSETNVNAVLEYDYTSGWPNFN